MDRTNCAIRSIGTWSAHPRNLELPSRPRKITLTINPEISIQQCCGPRPEPSPTAKFSDLKYPSRAEFGRCHKEEHLKLEVHPAFHRFVGSEVLVALENKGMPWLSPFGCIDRPQRQQRILDRVFLAPPEPLAPGELPALADLSSTDVSVSNPASADIPYRQPYHSPLRDLVVPLVGTEFPQDSAEASRKSHVVWSLA